MPEPARAHFAVARRGAPASSWDLEHFLPELAHDGSHLMVLWTDVILYGIFSGPETTRDLEKTQRSTEQHKHIDFSLN